MKLRKEKPSPAAAVQTAPRARSPAALYAASGESELRLYTALRDAVPVIDAALGKIQRLLGGFVIRCDSKNTEYQINEFIQTVKVNALGCGAQDFLDAYIADLLLYGNAVGEIVLAEGKIAALYNAPLSAVELKPAGPLDICVCRRLENGESRPVPYPQLVMASALNPPSGSAKGRSLLCGLPFVSGILVQVFESIGVNFERMGNVRFAVTYKPGEDSGDRAFAKERAQLIAQEWGKAMNASSPSDFVALGDVQIKAIGADNQILDSSVPVRQMLEQIVAKLGVPPFLLGLSWSSTERMSTQQADVLTSELEAYRRLLSAPLQKICELWMRLNGKAENFTVEWDNITLQDATELANARLLNARAAELEKKLEGTN